MSLQYKIRQFQNLFRMKKSDDSPVSWVYIYGLPRSGTTYALHQFMKITKAGVGDWELKEFAKAIGNAENRDWVALNSIELTNSIRHNLLTNAPVGGGSSIDIAVKQINTTIGEFEFYKKMFQTEPIATIFMFREPTGWLPSAIEKFRITESEAVKLYQSSLETYEQIGGQLIEYNDELPTELKKIELLKNIRLDEFSIKRKALDGGDKKLMDIYEAFKSKSNSL